MTKYEIMVRLQEMAQELIKLGGAVAALDDRPDVQEDEGYAGEFGRPGVLGLEEFKEALDNLRNTDWREDSVEDYKAYMALREAVVHTAGFLGLDGIKFSDEPKWPLSVLQETPGRVASKD